MRTTKLCGTAEVPQVFPRLPVLRIKPPAHDFDTCEAIMINHVPTKTAVLEAGLFQSKWFDYRRLHPINATYLFVWHYNRAHGDFLARTQDRSMRYVAAVKGKDIFLDNGGKGRINRMPFYRLRQKADELGIPYDVFTRAGFEYFEKQGWVNTPSPQHIASSPEAIVYIMDQWHVSKAAGIQWAEYPFYCVESWAGHPDQVEYENAIVSSIQSKVVKQYALHAALYERRALRIERAIAEFDEPVLLEAISLAEK